MPVSSELIKALRQEKRAHMHLWARFFMSMQLELMASAEVMPPQLNRFASLLDPQWIDEALAATGTASIRHQRLPAEQVIWLVIGLTLFRNDPIWPALVTIVPANSATPGN
jgi:hypothetical protein